MLVGRGSAVGIVTRYRLDGTGIEPLILVVEQSRVCIRSLAGIPSSNHAGGMDVCVVCCSGISDMRTENMKAHNG